GQLTLVLVLLVTATWALDRSGWSAAAGLLLGTAAAIKLFPAYLAVYFAARRRTRALLATAVSFLALTLATALVLGPDTFRDYLRVVLPLQARFRSLSYNLSIAGFWHKLFDPRAEVPVFPTSWTSPALALWGTLL